MHVSSRIPPRAPENNDHWRELFREAQASSKLPVPAPMPRPHDDAKLSPAASAYRAVMRGKKPRESMPSLADLQRQDSLWMSSQRPQPPRFGRLTDAEVSAMIAALRE